MRPQGRRSLRWDHSVTWVLAKADVPSDSTRQVAAEKRGGGAFCTVSGQGQRLQEDFHDVRYGEGERGAKRPQPAGGMWDRGSVVTLPVFSPMFSKGLRLLASKLSGLGERLKGFHLHWTESQSHAAGGRAGPTARGPPSAPRLTQPQHEAQKPGLEPRCDLHCPAPIQPLTVGRTPASRSSRAAWGVKAP